MRRRALSLAAAALTACGAKTGLDAPDAEVDAATPADAAVPIRCVEVPPDGSPVRVSFELPVSLAVADVFFLIDASASMADEIDTVRARLVDRVVPGVSRSIPDARFGLGFLGEFPVAPHGSADVRPYELRATITDDITRLGAQLSRAPTWGNFDDPEAQVEALYQVATGEGLAPWIDPLPGCPRGGLHGACFRESSLPVVVLITDAPFHNGPPGVAPEAPYAFPGPHSWDEMIGAVRDAGILVLGLGASDPRRPTPFAHLARVARDTGAVDADGRPLSFDIGSRGDGVGEGIVTAIARLAEGVPLDVDAIAEDVPGDEIDARTLVTAVRPIEARPPSGAGGRTESSFVDVVPGTRVIFEVEIDASGLPPSESTRRVRARILFRAFRRSRIGAEEIVIVVPGRDGGGSCEPTEGP